jgi:hypothetical protein
MIIARWRSNAMAKRLIDWRRAHRKGQRTGQDRT